MSLLDTLRASLGDRYRIERELGQGGMAVVYLAEDLRQPRKVAIKVLKPELAATVGPERFLREIALTAPLQHPNILPMFESGSAGSYPFYVMPYVEGESLRDRLKREGQLPLPVVLQLTREIADALDWAHSHNVVHRDIKPANILMAAGHAIIADFGIARAITSAAGDALTNPGLAVGTPEYMSPEQASASPTIDGRSDVYSLGCCVFEMLGGEPPFTGRTPQAVLARHQLEPVPSLGTLRPGIPAGVATVLAIALAKRPADRHATAGGFASALEAAALARAPTNRRVAWGRPAVLASVVLVLLSALLLARRRPPPLDRNRVVVFPLRDATSRLPEGTGEGVAIYIGHALDRTEPLKWLEGSAAIDPTRRGDVGRLAVAQASAVARQLRAAYYIDGTIVGNSDSVTVVLRLYDVAGDSLVRREGATGDARTTSLPRLGLLAVSRLLPSLLEPGRRVDITPLIDRRPGAIANFLQGEREYRRVQFAAALEHYQAALAEDSLLVLAAIKGAETANWREQSGADLQLLSVALARQSLLPGKYVYFARGLRNYVLGQADSAVVNLKRALAVDSSWGEAWMALGEVYFHLLPAAAPLDSLAEDAFDRSRALDPEFTPALFHLGQLALRRRDMPRAERLISRFRELSPDSLLSAPLGLALDCVRRGTSALSQPAGRQLSSSVLVVTGKWLASTVQHWPCARAVFQRVLAADSAPFPDRWGALLGLSSLMVASGQGSDLPRLLSTSGVQDLPAGFLYLLDATVDTSLSQEADSVFRAKGNHYRAMVAPTLWLLGTWASHRGAHDDLRAIAAALDAKVDSTRSRRDSLLARVAHTQVAIVELDSAAALRALRALRPTGPRSDIEWQPWEALAGERMALARILLSRGALDAADSALAAFDAPQPLIYALYLPTSLGLRAELAERQGRTRQARDLWLRRSALVGAIPVP